MACTALVGGLTLLLSERRLKMVLLPLVAFSAGSLIGGAFLHMIPAGLQKFSDNSFELFLWLLAGFTVFFLLEQLLHWHHCRRADAECRQPLSYLILLGDGLHNFIGGLAIAGIFLVDIRLGIMAWIAALAHEIPQEMGDFAVLLHSGWKSSQALLFNFISASTYLLGGLVTYYVSPSFNLYILIPFAAGNFIYIGASDLVPQVNKHSDLRKNMIHLAAFILGLLVMVLIELISVNHN
jgi:zinc and cadmium transporter